LSAKQGKRSQNENSSSRQLKRDQIQPIFSTKIRLFSSNPAELRTIRGQPTHMARFEQETWEKFWTFRV
jgi:hypothetical protein